MADKPTILAVEDDDEFHQMWMRVLEKNVHYIKAVTIEEGLAAFNQHRDQIGLIIMDACVPEMTPTTIPLIQEISKTFTGPIIACSSSPKYCQLLMEAGCSHTNNKCDVVKMVAKILDFEL